MEESSVKRKERLRAMREGSSTSWQTPSGTPTSLLLNPLDQRQGSAASPVETSSSYNRFDYYTDPVAAFQGAKRSYPNPNNPRFSAYPSPRPPVQPHFQGPRNIYMNHPPNLHPGNNFQYQGPSPQQIVPQPAHWAPPGYQPSPFPVRAPPSNPIRPGIWNRPPGSSGRAFSQSSPRGGYDSWNQAGRPRATYSGTGNNSYFGSSPSAAHSSQSSGHKVFQEHASAVENPEMFYLKIMVQDPWSHLEPVVGSILKPITNLQSVESSTSWLPKSIASKKAKVDEVGKSSGSQLSLAEYLAQSFQEAAANDAPPKS